MKQIRSIGFFVSILSMFAFVAIQSSIAYAAPTATSDGWGYAIDIPSLKSSKGIQTSTSGDGWVPIPYNGKVYNIFHHTGTSAVTMSCVDQATATTCPNFPAYIDDSTGVPLSTTATATNQLGTSYYVHTYLNQSSGNIYFAAQKATTAGIQCVNLNTHTSCGYTALYDEASLPGPGYASTFAGVEEHGGKLYGVRYVNDATSDSNPAQVYCFDTVTSAACSGYSYNTGQPLGTNALLMVDAGTSTKVRGIPYRVPTKIVGTKLYSVINYNSYATTTYSATQKSLGSRVLCFDTTTNGTCTNWPTAGVHFRGTNTQNDEVTTLFTNENAPDSIICAIGDINYVAPGTPLAQFAGECYNPATSAVVPLPTGLPTAVTSAGGIVVFDDTIQIGSRMLIPNAAASRVSCYDWATSSVCSGFPGNGAHNWSSVNGGNTKDYGYAYDADTQCMWGLGDSGYLWSFSSRDFTSNCYPSGTFFFDAALVYCDLSKAAYDTLTLQNIDSSKILASSYTIIDQNGDIIPGYQDQAITVDTPIDISNIPVTGATQKIQVLLKLETTDLTPWQQPTPPQLLFRFKPDGQARQNEVCTVPSNPTVSPSTPAQENTRTKTPKAPMTGVTKITILAMVPVAILVLISIATGAKRFIKLR